MGWVVPALLNSSQTHPALESGAGVDGLAWVRGQSLKTPSRHPGKSPQLPSDSLLSVFRHTSSLILSASGKTGSTVNREGDAGEQLSLHPEGAQVWAQVPTPRPLCLKSPPHPRSLRVQPRPQRRKAPTAGSPGPLLAFAGRQVPLAIPLPCSSTCLLSGRDKESCSFVGHPRSPRGVVHTHSPKHGGQASPRGHSPYPCTQRWPWQWTLLNTSEGLDAVHLLIWEG